jgi:hypothetical protein
LLRCEINRTCWREASRPAVPPDVARP